MASFGGLLVERDGKSLLVDAGLGPVVIDADGSRLGPMRGSTLLDDVATGRDPAGVEAFAVTHLHHDHIGWAW